MGVETSEIKIAAVHEVGCGLDDQLEGAKTDVYRWEGAKLAHHQMVQSVDGLMAHLKKDLGEEQIDLDGAEIAKRWLMRCRGVADNLLVQADAMIVKSKGKVEGLERAIQATKKILNAEIRKRDAFLSASTEEDGTARAVGTHPGPSLASQRKEAEHKELAELDGSDGLEEKEKEKEKEKGKEGAGAELEVVESIPSPMKQSRVRRRKSNQ